MKKKISPSVMCVDFFRLSEYINEFEKEGIDMLHIDIMDGRFVPNYTLGTDFVRIIKEKTDIPLDIHLMVEEPENKLDWFPFGEGDSVSVHSESTRHLHKAICAIRERGAKAFAAVNPATPVFMLGDAAPDISGVLVMTVDPGFAGQKMTEGALIKIAKTRKWLDESGFSDKEIEVDGNVSFENARKMSLAGANIFVAGTSSLFKKGMKLKDALTQFKKAIG